MDLPNDDIVQRPVGRVGHLAHGSFLHCACAMCVYNIIFTAEIMKYDDAVPV